MLASTLASTAIQKNHSKYMCSESLIFQSNSKEHRYTYTYSYNIMLEKPYDSK